MTQPKPRPQLKAQHEQLEYPGRWLNDDFSFEAVGMTLGAGGFLFPQIESRGGDCLVRHYFASRLLFELGYPTILTFGVVEARVGLRSFDVLTYFDPKTRRFAWDERGVMGHVWLTHIDLRDRVHLADFTVGHWPAVTENYAKLDDLPPVQWNVRFPDHWWLAQPLPSFIQVGKEDEMPPRDDFPLSGVFYGMHTVLHEDMMNEHAEFFEDADKDYTAYRDRLFRTLEYHQKQLEGRHLPKDG